MADYTSLNWLYNKLLSDETKEKSEKIILIIAIISFLVHLALIYLVDFNIIKFNSTNELLKNPISAIYTPFSFILVYEVYLLIYYLPKSITTYIGKQYEIMALIVIRRLFKDLSKLELSPDWFQVTGDLQFTYDIIAAVMLFYLIYVFYAKSKQNLISINDAQAMPTKIARFITFKKKIAVCLVPILVALAIFSFVNWVIGTVNAQAETAISFKNINNIFFGEFFTILIICDVILLLLSFFHTDEFHKVIRNSGFIISTILIRISFSVEGLINTVLIVFAITFGLLILMIHNKFEQNITGRK